MVANVWCSFFSSRPFYPQSRSVVYSVFLACNYIAEHGQLGTVDENHQKCLISIFTKKKYQNSFWKYLNFRAENRIVKKMRLFWDNFNHCALKIEAKGKGKENRPHFGLNGDKKKAEAIAGQKVTLCKKRICLLLFPTEHCIIFLPFYHH